MKRIYLAGGCFWGIEAFFKKVAGVVDTEVGYAQGHTVNPTYHEVCTGATGHSETIRVSYDEKKIGIADLLKYFFMVIDPTVLNRQGPDIGTQYRTGIYFENPEDEKYIVDFVDSQKSRHSKPIVVEVQHLRSFYEAEDYHQDYLDKNPGGYCHIDLSII